MKQSILALAISLSLLFQTACGANGQQIATAAATIVINLANAESAITTDPALKASLVEAAICGKDFIALYANGATPTGAQLTAAAGACIITFPVIPGEPTAVQVAIAALGASLETIVAFLPPPTTPAVSGRVVALATINVKAAHQKHGPKVSADKLYPMQFNPTDMAKLNKAYADIQNK